MNKPEPRRSLTAELQALVAHIAGRLDEAAGTIEAQASAATVLIDSPTMLDLEIAATVPAIPLPDGPLPVRAIVYDQAERPVGEILVWVREGVLVGLEQAWFTDEPPAGWPSPANVRLS